MTFVEMLQTISAKLNSLESENAILVANYKILNNKIKTFECKDAIDKMSVAVIEEATAYAASDNYERAIVVLENVSYRTSAMYMLLEECAEKYQPKVLQAVEARI